MPDNDQSLESLDAVLDQVRSELARAMDKFPKWPTRAIDALAIVHEEVGELAKEVLQLTYEPHKSTRPVVRKEAIQATAMMLRFCMSLKYYTYPQGAQHSDRLED